MMTVPDHPLPTIPRRVLRSILFAVASATCAMPMPAYAGPTISMPADGGCIGVSTAAITALNSEIARLQKEIQTLQNLLVRIEAATAESSEDTDVVQDVVNLFVDEPPNQGLSELMRLVQTELANRVTRLKVLQAEVDQAEEDLEDCERRLQSQTRFGQSETRLGPDVRYVPPPPYLNSLASSSDDRDGSRVHPSPGIGLGDGGTP